MGDRPDDIDTTQVIAYRTSVANRERLESLRMVMPKGTWRHLHEWLFDQPEVQRVIVEKIEGTRQ